MTTIVFGIYRQGKLELLEQPVGLREGRVRVILIEDEGEQPSRYLTLGKYRSGRLSTPDDFRDAEWHGETSADE